MAPLKPASPVPHIQEKPLQNRLLLWGIAVELSMIPAIVYTPLGNLLFGAAPLPPAVWALAACFAVTMFVMEEMRKRFVRKRASRAVPAGADEGRSL